LPKLAFEKLQGEWRLVLEHDGRGRKRGRHLASQVGAGADGDGGAAAVLKEVEILRPFPAVMVVRDNPSSKTHLQQKLKTNENKIDCSVLVFKETYIYASRNSLLKERAILAYTEVR